MVFLFSPFNALWTRGFFLKKIFHLLERECNREKNPLRQQQKEQDKKKSKATDKTDFTPEEKKKGLDPSF